MAAARESEWHPHKQSPYSTPLHFRPPAGPSSPRKTTHPPHPCSELGAAPHSSSTHQRDSLKWDHCGEGTLQGDWGRTSANHLSPHPGNPRGPPTWSPLI